MDTYIKLKTSFKIILKAFSILTLTVFTLISCAKAPKNDLHRLGLKGKVKSLREISFAGKDIYNYKKNEPYREIGASSYFDEDASWDKYFLFNPNGLLVHEYRFVANHCSKLLSCNVYEVAYYYDNQNKIIKTLKGSVINSSLFKDIMTNNDLEIEDNRKKLMDTKSMEIDSFKYNSNGTLIEKISYNNEYYNNQIEWRLIFELNSNNQVINEILYRGADNEFWTKNNFTYDSEGQLVEEQKFNQSGLATKAVFVYDNQGELIQEDLFYNDNKLISKRIFKYDSNMNIVELTRVSNSNSFNEVKTIRYEYDSNGNWITRYESNNGELSYVLKRKLEYFD